MTPMSNLSLYAPAFMHVYTRIHTYMHTIYISKCAHTCINSHNPIHNHISHLNKKYAKTKMPRLTKSQEITEKRQH